MSDKEFRRGNLLKYGGAIFIVNDIGEHGLSGPGVSGGKVSCAYDATHLSGIPLTEEWLVRMGLYKITGVTGRYAHTNGYFRFGDHCYIRSSGTNEPHFTIVTLDYTHESEEVVSTNIRYVHNVQNAYFILNGSELSINPEKIVAVRL